jgi:hypothetical protein
VLQVSLFISLFSTMKLTLKSSLLLWLSLLLYSGATQAQVRVNVNVGPPAWGPAVGPGVEYYYIPEIDGYYDLYTRQYVYLDPYSYWVSTPYLPTYYASYDPRFFHPVVINYVGRQPWGYIHDHRAYCGQRGWQPGYYRGNQGYGYNRGYSQNYGYRTPQPNYRPAPGSYGNNPYNNRGYAHSNEYNWNSRGNYRSDDQGNNRNNGRDNRSYQPDNRQAENRGYQPGPGRNDQGFQGSRDGQSNGSGGSRERGRGR